MSPCTDAARVRPLVVQHSFGDPGSGGPIGALERVLASDLSNRYEFVRMHQDRAAGGIDLPRIRAWVRLLKDVRPDLVHVRGLGNEGFHGVLAARLARCPRVLVSIHGTVRDVKGPRTAKQRIIVSCLEPLTMSMATHVTTVCQFAARREFVRRHDSKFVGPIVNGVEVVDLATASERAATRDELDLAPGDVALISVGRLSHDKGHRDLAAALRLLPAPLRARTVLVLVGDGPDRDEIGFSYAESGVSIRGLGRRLDVPRVLGAADVFVLPSLHENLSNALLEAMGRGLPVVATRVGGNTEVLEKGGGLLVKPRDPPGLALALSELIGDRDKRIALGRSAATVVRDQYSVEQMVAVLDETYRKVLSG